MTTMTTEQVLAHYGWTIECQSPYEIRHTDGSFATLRAARQIELSLYEDAFEEGLCQAVSE